jgi:hypothetical protein
LHRVGSVLSGVGWLIALYLLQDATALNRGSHPSEPCWLKAHGAFALFQYLDRGLLWGLHVPRPWTTQRRRLSGGTLSPLVLLIVSGYLLYYAADDDYRWVIAAVHWIVGLAFLIATGRQIRQA